MVHSRTKKEREATVRLLKANKKRCCARNIFGEDNIMSLDIIIDIVENDREDKWINENYPAPTDMGKVMDMTRHIAAMCALDYLNAETEADDLLFTDF